MRIQGILEHALRMVAQEALHDRIIHIQVVVLDLLERKGIYKQCSEKKTNPVCERRVNLLVYSLSLHRHSYIGFILAFASSIHNKQTKSVT